MGELQRNGIRPYEIKLQPNGIEGNIESFLESDVLILNIPPGRRDPSVETEFPAKIMQLLEAVDDSSIKHILFVSSTSVYAGTSGPVTEASPFTATKGSGQALISAEKLLEDARPELTVLRLSGLVGGDRHPGRFLAGKSNVPNPAHPVNLIHRDDCVNLIYEIIRQEKWGATYNASADQHPSRGTFYLKAAIKMGLRPPVFSSQNTGEGKLILNDHIKADLNYTFKFPDPELMVTEKSS